MADAEDKNLPEGNETDETVPTIVEASDYEAATGEQMSQTLDMDTWHAAEDMSEIYDRLEREMAEAVAQESRILGRVRTEIFPKLRTRPGAPANAGVYQADVEHLEKIHSGLLFTGAVEACDGTNVVHDSLPITIAQIGVCLVSYQGQQGAYLHRIFRRDLRVKGLDPVEEALQILDRRHERSGYDAASRRDSMSNLLRRGVMTFAERAVLLKRSSAQWRMGHGNPAPFELLTGSGSEELLTQSLPILYDLVLGHKKFVFVPSAPANRTLLTIGNALRPLEYAIVDTLSDWIERIVTQGHYRGEWSHLLEKVRAFGKEAGSKIVTGVYRASAIGPAHMFYAHVDHVNTAALIAMADSTLQEHRGFPMMIDLADTICRTTFGAETLSVPVQLAYAEAGEPFRYATERQSRK